MSYNIHPVNFIIISGILQCFVIGIVLFFFRQGNRSANKMLALLILFSALHFSWYMVLDSEADQKGAYVYWLPYSYLLAVGPLLFFYTRYLTTANWGPKREDIIHFIPVALEVAFQVVLIIQSITIGTQIYQGPAFLVYKIIQIITVAVSIFLYVKSALATIRSYESMLSDNFSDHRNFTLSWLYRLMKYLRTLWIFWLLFELVFIFFWKYQLHFIPVYLSLYVLLGIVTYSTWWIGMQGYNKATSLPENLVVKGVTSPTVQSSYARLEREETTAIAEKLNHLMQQEKLYRHETLNLKSLAERVNADPNLISYILNNVLNKSFFDYVNEFRVEEVKTRMSDPKYAHLKLIELAFESGFNSKATFNRVFKKITGASPSEFKSTSGKA